MKTASNSCASVSSWWSISAADIMEQAGTVITEWNERNIRDLVASARILSKEEILVRLKSGIERIERLQK